MLALKEKINRIRIKIKEKEEKSKNFKKEVTEALNSIFGNPEVCTKYIKNFYLKTNKLVIETKNKVFASEVFLKKDEIIRKLKGKINQITIR